MKSPLPQRTGQKPKRGLFPGSLNKSWEFGSLASYNTWKWSKKIKFWEFFWFDTALGPWGSTKINYVVLHRRAPFWNPLELFAHGDGGFREAYLRPLVLCCGMFRVGMWIVKGMHFSQSKNALLLNCCSEVTDWKMILWWWWFRLSVNSLAAA